MYYKYQAAICVVFVIIFLILMIFTFITSGSMPKDETSGPREADFMFFGKVSASAVTGMMIGFVAAFAISVGILAMTLSHRGDLISSMAAYGDKHTEENIEYIGEDKYEELWGASSGRKKPTRTTSDESNDLDKINSAWENSDTRSNPTEYRTMWLNKKVIYGNHKRDVDRTRLTRDYMIEWNELIKQSSWPASVIDRMEYLVN